jgi:hypothetical protein
MSDDEKPIKPFLTLVNKAFGNDRVAQKLFKLLGGELTEDRILKAIELYGAPRVDHAARLMAQKLKTEKIPNPGAFLNKLILTGGSAEKTSLSNEKQPSWSSQTPSGESKPPPNPSWDFCGRISDTNDIEELRRDNRWPLPQNKALYQRLSRDNRKPLVDEVAHKWPYLHDHAKNFQLDLLDDDFIEDSLFKTFSQILNDIRFERASHHLRNKIWNET